MLELTIISSSRSALMNYWPGSVPASRDQYANATCYLEVGGVRKCSAEIRAAFMPSTQLGVDFRDEVLESFLALRPATS